jgi:hypothetical protein
MRPFRGEELAVTIRLRQGPNCLDLHQTGEANGGGGSAARKR